MSAFLKALNVFRTRSWFFLLSAWVTCPYNYCFQGLESPWNCLWNISHYRIRAKKLLPKYFLWNMWFLSVAPAVLFQVRPGASCCHHLMRTCCDLQCHIWETGGLHCASDVWAASFVSSFSTCLSSCIPYLAMHPQPCPCPFTVQPLCLSPLLLGERPWSCKCSLHLHLAARLWSLDFQCPSEAVYSQPSLPVVLT